MKRKSNPSFIWRHFTYLVTMLMFSMSLLFCSINDISVVNWSLYPWPCDPSWFPLPSYRCILVCQCPSSSITRRTAHGSCFSYLVLHNSQPQKSQQRATISIYLAHESLDWLGPSSSRLALAGQSWWSWLDLLIFLASADLGWAWLGLFSLYHMSLIPK